MSVLEGEGGARPDAVPPPATRLDEETVRGWLLAHPEFITKNAALIARLAPTPESGENVVDLQSVLLKRLRNQVVELQAAQDMLVSCAEFNMTGLAQAHDAALRLIGATSFSDLVRVVTDEFPAIFDTPHVSLCIEADEAAAPAPAQPLPIGAVDRLIGVGAAASLREEIRGEPVIYGEQAAPYVASEALIRISLSPRGPDGVMAFGTPNPVRFHEDQASDLLQFLGAVASRAINRWLNLPRF